MPILVLGQTEKKIRSFTEINLGFADVVWVGWFPGASVLYGQIFQINRNVVAEYQGGYAFPAVVTGKTGIGFGNLDYNVMLSLRPWPLSVGPQIKLGIFTFSGEIATREGLSLEASKILSVGVRIKIQDK